MRNCIEQVPGIHGLAACCIGTENGVAEEGDWRRGEAGGHDEGVELLGNGKRALTRAGADK